MIKSAKLDPFNTDMMANYLLQQFDNQAFTVRQLVTISRTSLYSSSTFSYKIRITKVLSAVVKTIEGII